MSAQRLKEIMLASCPSLPRDKKRIMARRTGKEV